MNSWEQLENSCKSCYRCELANGRNNVVIGRGNPEALLMLIGEGPGEQEDLQGYPFVGPAGKLLDLLMEALEFEKKDYYIANIVKCRPPGNRAPLEKEAMACIPFLRAQVRLVRPKILVCLGATALKYIIDKKAKITAVRGQWYNKKDYWMMPTFHPAALLRDNSKKPLLFEDMKKVKTKLNEIRILNK